MYQKVCTVVELISIVFVKFTFIDEEVVLHISNVFPLWPLDDNECTEGFLLLRALFRYCHILPMAQADIWTHKYHPADGYYSHSLVTLSSRQAATQRRRRRRRLYMPQSTLFERHHLLVVKGISVKSMESVALKVRPICQKVFLDIEAVNLKKIQGIDGVQQYVDCGVGENDEDEERSSSSSSQYSVLVTKPVGTSLFKYYRNFLFVYLFYQFYN
eukprot:TRINITY_DN720_c1_g1_i2.p1 TRINITY_DN720_c1_g1~~TRINITY_DN720_c1_g1_i2.p1  ORF type:complete len:215 (-),score=11.02 TRINITY_DN720_c1_g1_i2:198-842(-)